MEINDLSLLRTCGVSIAQGRVKADIGQLATPHVLLLRRHVREDNLAVGEAHLLSGHQNVGLAHLRESEEKKRTKNYENIENRTQDDIFRE